MTTSPLTTDPRTDPRPQAPAGVLELFERRARSAPHAVALVLPDGELSYGTLLDRVRHGAAALCARGLRPGTVVAVDGGDPGAAVTALLAALWARGVVLPLDPSLPPDSRAALLAQTGAALLLRAGAADGGPAADAVRTLAFAELVTRGADAGDAEPAPSPAHDDACLVLGSEDSNSSGISDGSDGSDGSGAGDSPGLPRTVTVTMDHDTLARQVAWVARTLPCGPGERVAQLAGFTAGVLVRAVLPTLVAGGAVCLPSPGGAPEAPAAVLARLAASGATALHTAPTALGALLGRGEEEGAGHPAPDLSGLRLLCLSGEPLPAALVRRWRRAFPASAARCVNLYGAPGTAPVAAWYPVPEEPGEGIVPVGRGIDGTRLLVVNRRGRPCGVGELGEILVDTSDANGTSDRNGTGDAYGAYGPARRTGDLGRYLPDGSVECLGRRDDQVRIQGVRVHPAEVGAVLAGHPAVASAAVTVPVPEDGAGERRLVAHVVPAAGTGLDPDALRRAVAERLSAAAVPAEVVPLDALPLTAYGTLDRRALPAAGADPAAAREQAGAPRGGTEEAVAGYWAEVLGVPVEDRAADFFALGGHSLLMARVLSRVRRDFGAPLELRDLFEAPTVAALAARLDALGPTPGETAAADGGAEQDGRIPLTPGQSIPLTPEQGIPLTPEQEGVWFLEQLAPEAGAYNMAGVLALPAGVPAAWVRAALDRLVARHEALRTAFVVDEDRPVQRVLPPGPADFGVLPGAAGRDEALDRLTAEGARPFALTEGRPLRARLVRCADGSAEQFLGLTVHHLSCDGWSWDILLRELDGLLHAAREGREPEAAAPAPRFAEHALRSRGPGQEARRAAAVAFWRAHLGTPPPVLDLPTARPRPPVRTHRGAVRPVPVPDGLGAALSAYCRDRGVTPYMALLAAFGLVLAHTADQDEVVLGTDSAGRDRADTEQTVGFFVRTHALRLDLGGGPDFDEAVGRVREVLLASHPHQHLSFSRLVEAVRPVRDPSRTPVFQVMLRMPPDGSGRTGRLVRQLSGGELPADAALAPAAKFDLTLVARAERDRLRLDVEYHTDLFDAGSVDALGGRLVALLAAAVREPDRPRAVSGAGRPAHPFGAALPARPQPRVAAEFARRAAETPGATALRCAGGRLGYGELAARVAATARRLRPGEVTAVVGGKHPDAVTALLAAVTAGAVAVPVDEELPEARQRALAELAGATAVLAAGRDRRPPWCEAAGLPVVEVARAADAAPGAVPEVPHPGTPDGPAPGGPPSPDAPACVFFTSGSTGTPKGVLGAHRGLDHFAAWERAEFAIGPGDRVAQLTTFSFDAVLRDVFVPLTAGAALCLPPAAAREDALRLLEWLAAERITVVHTTPSVAASWLALGADAAGPDLSALRLICLAGEPLTGELVTRLRTGLRGCRAEIVNFYGPTETMMIKTFLRVPERPGAGVLPVGGPLPGAQVAVLGRDGRPCLPYERGEIVLRTPYRARYLSGEPGGFRPNSFCREPDPDDLLFRTGDTAVVGADGAIVPTGRRDSVVKVNGVRADPAEVAAALATHPEVTGCHVEPHRDADRVSLVAYVVRVPDARVSTEALRAHAAGRLPAALLPALVLFVDALPLLPNGKPDRDALLGGAAGTPRAAAPAGRAEPRTPEEARLLRVWRDVLGRPETGVTDDFFAVGGHSLLATVLITRIRKEFGVAVSLRDLLAAPRVDRLAPVLAALGAEGPEGNAGTGGAAEGSGSDGHGGGATGDQGPLLLLREGPAAESPLFLVHPMGGDVVCYRPLVRALPPGPAVHAFRAPALDGGPVPRDLRELAARYLHELRRVRPSGPYRLGGWSFGGAVAAEMARQLSFDGERTELLVLLDSYAPGGPAYGGTASSARADLRAFAEDVGRLTGADPAETEAALLRTPQAGAPEAETTAELRRRLALFGAHRACAARYRAATPRLPGTRVLLFAAGAQRRPEGTTAALGWAELLGRAVDPVVVADTDHYSVITDAGVAARLGEALRER
ncbi:AMP-binding protein [Streptomyces sp. PsTaAH-124]|uniref:AMP-binding protein n=1 Tax=Streptomyces sp. PsTaAH-124 TaxID=1157638 RepID=UPI0003662934|nr:AMP-binding protein [Streptomyces sp. PsTaAH-124]